MGDVYERGSGEGGEARLNLAGLLKGDTVKIVSERGEERRYTAERDGEAGYSWAVLDRRFYRAEVWRYFPEAGRELPAALSNPVYLGGKTKAPRL